MDDPAGRYAEALAERVAYVRSQREALITAIEETRQARSLTFSDDEHDPDGSLASLDQARDVALLRQSEQTLTELTDAQARLADGSYGSCQTCHRSIEPGRLLARPETRSCLSCAQGNARSRRRT